MDAVALEETQMGPHLRRHHRSQPTRPHRRSHARLGTLRSVRAVLPSNWPCRRVGGRTGVVASGDQLRERSARRSKLVLVRGAPADDSAGGARRARVLITDGDVDVRPRGGQIHRAGLPVTTPTAHRPRHMPSIRRYMSRPFGRSTRLDLEHAGLAERLIRSRMESTRSPLWWCRQRTRRWLCQATCRCTR